MNNFELFMEGNTNKPSVRKNDIIRREIHKAITPIFSGRAKQYKNTHISKCLSSQRMRNMATLERVYKNTTERKSNAYFCNKENFDRLTQLSMNIVDVKTEPSESRIIWRKKRKGLSSMDQIIK